MARNPKALIAKYNALPETKGGRLIDTDIARELSPHYARSKESRAELAKAMHDPSSKLAKLAYAAQLSSPVDETPLVVIRGGGTGAGKSTAIPVADGAITYDTTLSSLKSAREKIDAALASGREVQINYVYRRPDESLHGAAKRAEETGRTVPKKDFARTHVESNKVIRQIGRAYEHDKRVRVSVFNNSSAGLPKIDLPNLPEVTYNGVRDAIDAHIAQAADTHGAGGLPSRGDGALDAGGNPAGSGEVPAPGSAGVGRLSDESGSLTSSRSPLDDATSQLRTGMRGGRKARKAQEAGYSAERAKRFAMFEDAVRANPTREGYEDAKTHLAGALPKLDYEGFGELNQEAMDALIGKVVNHPTLLTGHRLNVIEGLKTAASGGVPTTSQLNLIEYVFGKDVAHRLADPANLGILGHGKDLGYEILNVPRSIMATFDLSAVLRQGLVLGTRHPIIAAKNIGPMLRMFKSQSFYDDVMKGIKQSDNYPLYEDMDLAIMELGPLSKREEAFYSNIAEKYVPGVKLSSRAYTGYLTKFRADVADHLLQRFATDGVNVHDPEFLKSLGKFINSATGRGTLGALEGSAKVLNTVFFSPRLMASRFNFLSPRYYYKLHPAVRKEALRAALHTVGTLGTVLALASYAGAKVGRDPRNADFAKIRLGNTRVDA